MVQHVPPHPSPHRSHVPVGMVFLGFVLAPMAWVLTMIASYAFTSYPCFPGPDRRTSAIAGWHWVSTLVPILLAVGIVLAAAGGVVSYRAWTATRTEAAGHPLDIGEGRTRFMAAWGMMTSALFVALLVFNFINYLLVPLCAT